MLGRTRFVLEERPVAHWTSWEVVPSPRVLGASSSWKVCQSFWVTVICSDTASSGSQLDELDHTDLPCHHL